LPPLAMLPATIARRSKRGVEHWGNQFSGQCVFPDPALDKWKTGNQIDSHHFLGALLIRKWSLFPLFLHGIVVLNCPSSPRGSKSAWTWWVHFCLLGTFEESDKLWQRCNIENTEGSKSNIPRPWWALLARQVRATFASDSRIWIRRVSGEYVTQML
jgi:hypothetical protein